MNPTQLQIRDAREILEDAEFPDVDDIVIDAVRTLVDATALPDVDENKARDVYVAYQNAFWGTSGDWDRVTDADKRRWATMAQYLNLGKGATR